MIKDKLQIYLVTYNRKHLLENTFQQIFSQNSPIKDFDITILDNASTDGTSELIDEYAKIHPNIKHIRHPHNIGGNANICRAYEMSASCGKEYAWILCDDDRYDFSNWQEVEENINSQKDIICVCDYAIPNTEDKIKKTYQILQLTFVPSGIFKTNCISDSVLHNMYDNIYTMFQQTCLTMKVINNGGKIQVLSKPIVHNGIFVNDSYNFSYTRGTLDDSVSERKKHSIWILGFVNVLTLANDKNLIGECMEASIPSNAIYHSWEKFYISYMYKYFNIRNFNYFYEIFKYLKPKRKFEVIKYLLTGYIRLSIRILKIKLMG